MGTAFGLHSWVHLVGEIGINISVSASCIHFSVLYSMISFPFKYPRYIASIHIQNMFKQQTWAIRPGLHPLSNDPPTRRQLHKAGLVESRAHISRSARWCSAVNHLARLINQSVTASHCKKSIPLTLATFAQRRPVCMCNRQRVRAGVRFVSVAAGSSWQQAVFLKIRGRRLLLNPLKERT